MLAAALKLADRQGLEALSMRTLAQALKVEAMSLYNHVGGKEEILDGLTDLVAGELQVPAAGGDWKAAMRARATTAHAVLMKHPWATQLFVSRLNIGPNMLRYVDATITCLRSAGFSWPMADWAWNGLDAYTYGFTLQRLNFPLEPAEYAKTAANFIHLIPADRFPGMHGLSSEIIAGRHDGLQPFELGLDILLDGYERLRLTADARGP